MRTKFRILFAALLLSAFLLPSPVSAFGGPTAIIVDDETGEPIEGAIALAQWVKYKPTMFEGGIPYAAKARETVSDKEGKIYIKGYWMWIPFAGKTAERRERRGQAKNVLRLHEHTGSSLGDETFVTKIERILGKALLPRKAGRPKKQIN